MRTCGTRWKGLTLVLMDGLFDLHGERANPGKSDNGNVDDG